MAGFVRFGLWDAVRKNIISDRFSTKTAISAHVFSYLCAEIDISEIDLCAHLAISAQR